jgi:hypothetical protein
MLYVEREMLALDAMTCKFYKMLCHHDMPYISVCVFFTHARV